MSSDTPLPVFRAKWFRDMWPATVPGSEERSRLFHDLADALEATEDENIRKEARARAFRDAAEYVTTHADGPCLKCRGSGEGISAYKTCRACKGTGTQPMKEIVYMADRLRIMAKDADPK